MRQREDVEPPCVRFDMNKNSASSFSSSSLVTLLPPPPSLSLIPFSDEAFWRTTNFSCLDTQQTMTGFTILRGSPAALFNVGASAAKLLMLPSTRPASV